MKAKRNAEEEDDPQPKQMPDSSLGEGLLDLPPSTQLRLQRRLQRSRSRSGSPCIESVRHLVIRNHYPQQQQQPLQPQKKKEDVPVDDRMRIDCNRIGKHNCCCSKEDVESSSSSSVEQSAAKLQHTAGHGDRWGHDLEKGRSGREGPDLLVGAERGRSRRSRKDGFEDDKSTVVPVEAAASTLNNSTSNQSKSVPTSDDKLRFQRSLNSAASLLFHTAAGCSSPKELGAKGQLHGRRFTLNKFLRAPPLRMSSSPLLGSFEVFLIKFLVANFLKLLIHFCFPPIVPLQECLLNGRLEPMSTVEGFRAELGASGSFCPSHELLPVSVFFYNFGGLESDKTASPYLAHLNLGAKG